MKSDRTLKRNNHDFEWGLALYLGLACFFTFFINMVCEPMAFRNLDAIRVSTPDLHLVKTQRVKSWYKGWQIIIPDFPFKISKMDARHWWYFLLLVVVFSALVGLLAYALRHRPRLILIPFSMYIISTVLFSTLHPGATGIFVAAVSYSIIYFVGRGIREFNPHWKLKEMGLLDQSRRSTLSRMFFQYTITSLGAIAFIVLACVFNSAPLLRNALGGNTRSGSASVIIPALEVPFVIATAWYAVIGCTAVGIFITRELHIKSDELMQMSEPGEARFVVEHSDLATHASN